MVRQRPRDWGRERRLEVVSIHPDTAAPTISPIRRRPRAGLDGSRRPRSLVPTGGRRSGPSCSRSGWWVVTLHVVWAQRERLDCQFSWCRRIVDIVRLHIFSEISWFSEFFQNNSDFFRFLQISSENLSEIFWKTQSQCRDFGARLRITFYASEKYFQAWFV